MKISWQQAIRALPWLALVTLLLLAITPQTRWILGLQVGSTLRLIHPFSWTVQGYWPQPDSSYTGLPSLDTKLEQAALKRNPNDLPMQIAYARTLSRGSEGEAPPLRTLLPRFPNSPSLYANLLRCATDTTLVRDRPEIDLLDGIGPREGPYRVDSNQHPPIPGDDEDTPEPAEHRLTPAELAGLALYDHDAAIGERLDPTNAYFPFMRAAGFYAAHHDTQALAAIQRASAKPLWKEYYSDEAEGDWRLHTEAFGDKTGINRVAATSSIQLPQYSRLAATAKIATYQAMLAEQAGNVAKGIAIRQEVMRCGSLMRVQAPALLGTFAGMAIVGTSRRRPGGAIEIKPKPFSTPIAPSSKNFEAYCSYLRQHGYMKEEREARAERAAWKSIRHILHEDDPHLSEDSPNPVFEQGPYGRPLRQLTLWWLLDLSLLSNILWMLILGAIAFLLSRIPRIREGQPQPSYLLPGALTLLAVIVILSGLALLVYWFVNSVYDPWAENGVPDAEVCMLASFLFGMIAIAVLLAGLFRQSAKRGADNVKRWTQKIMAFLKANKPRVMVSGAGFWFAVLLLFAAIGFAAYWQSSVLRDFNHFMDDFGWYAAWYDTLSQPEAVIAIISLCGFLALPILTLLILAIASLARRVPLAVGLVRGFRDAALPIASLLVLIYAGLLLGTLRQESVVSHGLERMQQQGEGPYYAALTHQSWPGQVR